MLLPLGGPLISPAGKATKFACSLSHETVIFGASQSANKTRYATLIDRKSVTATVVANVLLSLLLKENPPSTPPQHFDLMRSSLAMTHTQAVVPNYTLAPCYPVLGMTKTLELKHTLAPIELLTLNFRIK